MMEMGTADVLFNQPLHPYTRALLSAVPQPDPNLPFQNIMLKGEPPDPRIPPAGCRFSSRCPKAQAECQRVEPEFKVRDNGSGAACILLD
jgi:oligopeptide/dipeptide ABC transporter ATP-binding protein